MGCNTSPTTGEFYCDSTPVNFPPSDTATAKTVTHSAWDWANLVSGALPPVLTAVQNAGTPKPTSNLGIPGAKTPTVTPVTSKTAGYLIGAVIILVLIIAFRRVTRR